MRNFICLWGSVFGNWFSGICIHQSKLSKIRSYLSLEWIFIVYIFYEHVVADIKETNTETAPNSTTIILTPSLPANNNRKIQIAPLVTDESEENENLFMAKTSKEPIQENLTGAVDTTETLQLLPSDGRIRAPNRVGAMVNARNQGQKGNRGLTVSKQAQAKSDSFGVEEETLSSSSALSNVVRKVSPPIEYVSKKVRNVQNSVAAAKSTQAKFLVTRPAKHTLTSSTAVHSKNDNVDNGSKCDSSMTVESVESFQARNLKRLATTSESGHDITKIRKTLPDPTNTNAEFNKSKFT